MKPITILIKNLTFGVDKRFHYKEILFSICLDFL